MHHRASVSVLREVDAVLIPSGDKVKLQPGTLVSITQALGDAYTLHVNGHLVRVAGKEGDALGLVILESPDINTMEGTLDDKITAQLKTCYDPEIPVNVNDLGLVYDIQTMPLGKDEYALTIVMTLTAAGCGMGPILVQEVKEKCEQIQEVKQVTVELTFDPPWDRDRMSDEAKLQLGML